MLQPVVAVVQPRRTSVVPEVVRCAALEDLARFAVDESAGEEEPDVDGGVECVARSVERRAGMSVNGTERVRSLAKYKLEDLKS